MLDLRPTAPDEPPDGAARNTSEDRLGRRDASSPLLPPLMPLESVPERLRFIAPILGARRPEPAGELDCLPDDSFRSSSSAVVAASAAAAGAADAVWVVLRRRPARTTPRPSNFCSRVSLRNRHHA